MIVAPVCCVCAALCCGVVTGYFGMVVMYVVCGIVLASQGSSLPRGVFYSLYGLSFFFCNMGPNTTTFVIPSEIFPTSIRASAHGISAATGKVGAVIGTALMPVILDASSLPAVMFASAAIALSGLVFTLALTRESQHTDIMGQQRDQHNHQQQQQHTGADTATADDTRGGDGSGRLAASLHSAVSRASSNRKAALQSLSLSRAIRKARGYTDILKEQSSIDQEEEDEPAHIDMELGPDEDDDHYDSEEEHRMDGLDSESAPTAAKRESRDDAEALRHKQPTAEVELTSAV